MIQIFADMVFNFHVAEKNGGTQNMYDVIFWKIRCITENKYRLNKTIVTLNDK